jgi:ribose 5-phosphate isomerase B
MLPVAADRLRSGPGMNAHEAPARIAIGSDDVGLELKEAIAAHLRGLPGHTVRCLDLTQVGDQDIDLPEVAQLVAESTRRGEADRGILVWIRVGMVIAANKGPGIRAAQCHDVYSAEYAHNGDDAQIIVLSAALA